MQFMSADEKVALERKREELYQLKVDVQERIRKAAALGDLSENAEYHFAKEENRHVERQIAELESKLKNAAVVSNEDVPEDVRREMTFVMVETVDEVLKEALDIDLPGPIPSYAGNGLTPVQSAP